MSQCIKRFKHGAFPKKGLARLALIIIHVIPCLDGIFHELNHPVYATPMAMETPHTSALASWLPLGTTPSCASRALSWWPSKPNRKMQASTFSNWNRYIYINVYVHRYKSRFKYKYTYIYIERERSHVGKTILNHPQITIFVGDMVTIPKWVVYDLFLPTLQGLAKIGVPQYVIVNHHGSS